MKNKLNYLTTMSLTRKIKTKWFLVANILFAILIIGLTNIDSVVKFFGGDFNEPTKIYVIDETNYTYDIFKEQIKLIDKEKSKYKTILYKKDLKSLKKKLKDEDKKIGFVIKENSKNYIDVSVISNDYIDTLDYQYLNQAVNTTKTAIAVSQSNISPEELTKIYEPIKLKRIILDKDKNAKGENYETIMNAIFPVFILPFFMLTMFLIQMIGAEINDEKTTRGMEIIISNVSPKVHFFSKIIAGNLFVIIQGALLIAYAAIGLLIRHFIGTGSIEAGLGIDVKEIISGVLTTEFISKLKYILPLTLILMVITFISYSLLAGILASMTTNAEDFNQLQTPLVIISLVGYYLAMMASVFKGALFIRILAYVPLISAILAPSLLVIGQIGIIDVIISILIALVVNYLLIKYGLKIYKVGILNYSSKDLWKKMFKALKD